MGPVPSTAELQRAYTAAEYAAGVLCPKVGEWREDLHGNKYIFAQNGEGASAITEGVGCVSKGATNRTAYKVTIGGAGEGELFAGVRVPDAASLAAGLYGWFQVKGKCTFAGSTVTADTPVDLGASGVVADAANDAAGAKGSFGVARDAASTADAEVDVKWNVWSL